MVHTILDLMNLPLIFQNVTFICLDKKLGSWYITDESTNEKTLQCDRGGRIGK